MKNKPLRHKASNLFKFQPFGERISSINVDVFHRVSHENEDADEGEGAPSYFYQRLQKWDDLNYSESYKKLRKELPDYVKSPADVFAHKEQIVSVLLAFLKNPDTYSIQTALELVVAAAQDLEKEFYPFYFDVFHQLVYLLNCQDADQLEWTFTCLAYLLKFLWRVLVKNVTVVFKTLVPLLSSSKPWYINNFAADTFAFVARKVKDKKSFLNLVLANIDSSHDDKIAGCGRLLFAIVKGLTGQFHSCANHYLPFLFESLADNDLSHKVLFKILLVMLEHIHKSISPRNCDLLWTVLLNTSEKFLERWKLKPSQTTEDNINEILSLILTALKSRDAASLSNPNLLVNVLMKYLDSELLEPMNKCLLEVVATLLKAQRVQLSQELAVKISSKIFSKFDFSLSMEFAKLMLEYKNFETLILPSVLNFCGKIVNDENRLNFKAVELLAEIVSFKTPCYKTCQDLTNWQSYSLTDHRQRSAKEMKLGNSCVEYLLSLKSSDELLTHFEDMVNILIILPHFNTICSSEEKISAILKINQLILEALQTMDDHQSIRKFFHLLNFVMINIIKIDGAERILLETSSCENQVNTILQFCCKDFCKSAALRALDFFIFAISSATLEPKLRSRIENDIIKELGSPFHQIRLLALNILVSLHKDDEHEISTNKAQVYGFMLNAENTEVSIASYRDKMIHLQKLEYSSKLKDLLKDNLVAPLNYLFGTLFINFKLIWTPVNNIVTAYANSMPVDKFWPIYRNQLVYSAELCKNRLLQHQEEELPFQCAFQKNLFSTLNSLEEKPDYFNYRCLLLENLNSFVTLRMVKSDEIYKLFLSFIEHEYKTVDQDVAQKWNIKQHSKFLETDPEESLAEGEEETSKMKPDFNSEMAISSKQFNRLLMAHLKIVCLPRNKKYIDLESKLTKVYEDLLMHRSSDIQKLAFDCIISRKYEYLSLYSENIYRLIDDKTFKSELTSFRIDTNSDIICPEHRPNLMPIILRILYSKMLNTKKVGSRVRRTTILRYLAGCDSKELEMFVEMSFKLFMPYVRDISEIHPVVCVIMSSLDLENTIPPRQLFSSITLAGVILTQSGGLMNEDSLRLLLKVILAIGANMAGIFTRWQNVHSGYHSMLNKIKNAAIDLITIFFKRFEAYSWTVDEINAIFHVFIWPWLRRLPFEGIFSPTSLFKLLTCWSENPRYFNLLAKPALKDGVTPLEILMKLLLNEKTHGSVCNGIFEMIERLLTLSNFKPQVNEDEGEEEVVIGPIPIDYEPKMPENNKLRRKLNLGSCLLYPHLYSILKKLQSRLFVSRSKTLSSRDLLILSRVTEIADGNELGESLLSLIIPVLLNKSTQAEEVVYPLLTTTLNLVKPVKIDQSYLRKLACLFGNVSHISCRKMLLTLTKVIDSKLDGLNLIDVEILSDLNAFDAKWVEQPDFDRRLKAFRCIEDKVDNQCISPEFGVILIHNFCHFINHESDMALLDRSSFCLKKLCTMLCSKYKSQDLNFIVNQTIAPIMQKSLKDIKNEKMYRECVSLLGCLVRECPHAFFVFEDFSPLANKDDLELDFFENLLHLQLHRKVRALLKFSKMCKEMKKQPNLQSLVNYALPLVTQFLCTPEHLGHNTIIDAAVEALGSICRLLPWQQYYAILQFYLSKLKRLMEFQKQLVKIVKTILDAFHFDLSRAAEIKWNKNARQKKIQGNNGSKIVLHGLSKGLAESSSVDTIDPVDDNAIDDEDLTENRIEEETTKNDENNDDETVEKESNDNNDDNDDNDDIKTDKDEDLEKLERDLAIDASSEMNENLDDESVEELIFNRVIVLKPVEASKIIHKIISSLLPQIRGTIAERSLTEKCHKSNKKYAGPSQEDEDILRIPLALAIVQLLQKLPDKLLKNNLPGLFIKLCMFLTSRLESVRRVTRQTLQEIVLTLGPSCLETLITEMITLLTKGFHVYVLVHTLHSVLVAVKPLLKLGDIDRCLPLILKVCVEDVFGSIAEGKEASQAGVKWVEARGNRSYDVFHILGEFVSQRFLLNLILPLKEELATSFSHTQIFRVQECLRHIVLGLINNQFLSTEALLIFAYGVTSQSIPALLKGLEPISNLDEKDKILAERRNPDCFIIPAAPKERPKVETHIYAKTNAHILVEFGLRLYHFLLKKEKVKDAVFHQHLDPLVSILSDCLKSGKVRLTILALNCFCWIFKFDLPSLRKNIGDIAQQLFSLLHKYAAAGLSKGDNFELVQVSFKAMSVLVRDVKYHKITKDQLRTLLLYAEQDLYDYSRQATAFTLLKVIIGKKLTAPEIHSVMEKVASLSITADLPHVRLQARQVFHSFLMNYPLRNKIEEHLTFYLKQLDYDHQTGRESALEMMNVVINTFPESMLANFCGLFFLWLGPRLVNDPAPECRKMAAACISRLLCRSNKEHVNKLFDMVLVWMSHPKTIYRRLAVQLCGLFIKHEKSEFKARVATLMPIICSHLIVNFDDDAPGRFVRISKSSETDTTEEAGNLMKDHHLYQLLHMLVKLCAECPDIFSDEEFKEGLQAISAKAQELLGHPHEWVRLGAAELLHCMLNSNSPADIATLANTPAAELEYSPGFLRTNVRETLKSLILDHVDQLMPGAQILDKLLIQVMKNLVYIGEVLKDVKEIEGEVKVSLIWLVRKLRQRINLELARAPLCITIRTMVFNWFSALALKFNKEELKPIIFHVLAPIVREQTTVEAHLEELRNIAKEVSGYYKQKFGSQEYSQLVHRVQNRLDIKRAERKRSRAVEVVKNPEKAAKRKIKKQLKTKEQKKRKNEQFKSGVRKRKIQSVDFED